MSTRYNALIDQAARALKDHAEKEAGILMQEAAHLHGGDPWVAQCAVRDDVSARLGDLTRLTGVEIGRLIDESIRVTVKGK
jgi:hypothetical protein